MNKSELVDAIAAKTGVTKSDAAKVLDGFFEVASEVVGKGDEKITLPGFLSIERTHRAARSGRNPATGEAIQIPAGYGVKVAAGSKLKNAAK